MSRWYRAYEGTVTDAKLGEVALVAECSRSVAIAAWHCLLESAAAVNDGGKFDCTPRRVAVILGESPALIERVMAEMGALGMIGDGAICAWARRQYESDTSTERSRKHRERKRNGDATLQGRRATVPDTDTDTEEETEKKEVTARAAALYAFSGRTIRLKPSDLSRWQKNFPDVDVAAHLQSRDDWLTSEADDATRKKWFVSTSSYLAGLQQKATNRPREPAVPL